MALTDSRYRRARVWILAGVATLLSLCCAELGLRIAGIPEPNYYTRDRVLGAALRPGVSGRWTREGSADVRVNSAGMRDREHAVSKPPATLRIAVLGDSYAEALQVPTDKAFWAVLERDLSRCAPTGGRTVEVLNFGVSGYGTAQELLMLRERVWKYAPDLVLLAFLPGNDVRNNSRELEPDNLRPFFFLEGDRLVLDDSFLEKLGPRAFERPGFLVRMVQRFRVLELVDQARDAARQRAQQQAATVAAAGALETGLDDPVFAPPRDERWVRAWQLTAALLVAMRDDVESHGAAFWVAVLDSPFQVNPDPAARAQALRHLGSDDPFYADQHVAAIALEARVPVVQLGPPLARYAAVHHTYLHGFPPDGLGNGHWNETGHRLAGEILAQRICASWSRSPTPR